jgi:hypothetical protein
MQTAHLGTHCSLQHQSVKTARTPNTQWICFARFSCDCPPSSAPAPHLDRTSTMPQGESHVVHKDTESCMQRQTCGEMAMSIINGPLCEPKINSCQEHTAVTLRMATPRHNGTSTVCTRPAMSFGASNLRASEVASTKLSISGIVNTAITFEVAVSSTLIAILPPTVCRSHQVCESDHTTTRQLTSDRVRYPLILVARKSRMTELLCMVRGLGQHKPSTAACSVLLAVMLPGTAADPHPCQCYIS